MRKGELRGPSQWVQLIARAQINFEDLTPFLTHGSTTLFMNPFPFPLLIHVVTQVKSIGSSLVNSGTATSPPVQTSSRLSATESRSTEKTLKRRARTLQRRKLCNGESIIFNGENSATESPYSSTEKTLQWRARTLQRRKLCNWDAESCTVHDYTLPRLGSLRVPLAYFLKIDLLIFNSMPERYL